MVIGRDGESYPTPPQSLERRPVGGRAGPARALVLEGRAYKALQATKRLLDNEPLHPLKPLELTKLDTALSDRIERTTSVLDALSGYQAEEASDQ